MERALIKFNPNDSHTSENLKSPYTRKRKMERALIKFNPNDSHTSENLKSPYTRKRKMERALIKFNPDDSHTSENLKSPYTRKRKRLCRRREVRNDSLKQNCMPSVSRKRLWRRREVRNDSLKQNCIPSVSRKRLWRRQEVRNDSLKRKSVPSVSRTTAKIHGNTTVFMDKNDHMIDDDDGDDDDVATDWAIFMAAYSGYDDDDEVDENYESFVPKYNPNIENESDEMDEDYKSFLSTSNPDIENDSDEADEDYKSFLSKYNPDIENDNDEADADYRSFLPTYDPDVQIDSTSNHNGCSNIEVDFGKNNEDCGLHNSEMIVNGDEEYMYDMNAAITSQLEHGSNSSDSDLIVLDSHQICQDTPFVPSKMYDSSWYGEEMNPKDNMQAPAYDDSHFRRRLMEHLERPYDRKEYKDLINRLINRTQKERHFETRQRVVESYHSDGVTTPFHKAYPDISKAIYKVSKEKPRVLFLLRGFFFWLENVAHEGVFQPWHDELCLELMRKM